MPLTSSLRPSAGLWQMMHPVLPVANEDGTLYGMFSAGDVASYAMLAVRNSTVKNVPAQGPFGGKSNEGGQIRDEISGEVTIALPAGRENLLPDSYRGKSDQRSLSKRALELRVTCVIVCQAEVAPGAAELTRYLHHLHAL